MSTREQCNKHNVFKKLHLHIYKDHRNVVQAGEACMTVNSDIS